MFRNGNFVNAGNKFWFPDDVTLGYIIGKMKISFCLASLDLSEGLLGVNLTVIPEFHSHLEAMTSLTPPDLTSHISFSYLLEEEKNNVISLEGPFTHSVDPTRYKINKNDYFEKINNHCFSGFILYSAPFSMLNCVPVFNMI